MRRCCRSKATARPNIIFVLADDLRTGLLQPTRGDDDETWKLRVKVWRDERTLLGGSDAGAHLDGHPAPDRNTAPYGHADARVDLSAAESGGGVGATRAV